MRVWLSIALLSAAAVRGQPAERFVLGGEGVPWLSGGGHRDPATGQVVDEGWAPAGLPVESGDSGYEALRTKAGGS